MRLLGVLIAVAGCLPPPRSVISVQPEFVPSREERHGWLDRTVALRTMLGRANITLVTQGQEQMIESRECTTGPTRLCTRCVLLGEEDGLPDSALEELVGAFARYPVALLDAAKIERVALCNRLDHGNDRPPAGLADPEERLLYVSVESLLTGRGGYSIDHIAETAHHEVYHLLDIPVHSARLDPEWDQLNAHGFAYGGGKTDHSNPRPFGFVDAYATTSGVEDRASTFQFLMTRGEELCTLAKDDPALHAKARLVWRRVAAITDPAFLRAGVPCAAELQ